MYVLLLFCFLGLHLCIYCGLEGVIELLNHFIYVTITGTHQVVQARLSIYSFITLS